MPGPQPDPNVKTTDPETRVTIYDINPFSHRDPVSGDPGGALQQYFGAIEEELQRQRNEIRGVGVLIDVDGLNTSFLQQGNLYFNFNQNPEQLVVATVVDDGNYNLVNFQDSGVTSSEDNFFVGYSLRGLRIEEQGGIAHPLSDEVSTIVSYDGASKQALVSPAFSTSTGGSFLGFELGYPLMSFVPIVDDTELEIETATLPDQSGLAAPLTSIRMPYSFDDGTIISTQDGHYENWTIEWLSGGNAATIRSPLLTYDAATRVVTFNGNVIPARAGDQLKFTVGRKLVTTTDYYTGYYLRIVSGPGSGPPIQTRKIVNSYTAFDSAGRAVYGVMLLDTPWNSPPVQTSVFGITPSFVSLAHIAEQVGYEPDATDPEILQKQQILSAVDFYKLKGTLRSFDLLFRTFGFDSTIIEISSNYTHAPTGDPGVCEDIHIEETAGPSIGRPHRIESVVCRDVFVDQDFALSETGILATQGGAAADEIIFPTTFESGVQVLKNDDFYNGSTITMRSGGATGDVRTVLDYTGATRTAQVDSNWTSQPGIGDQFDIADTFHLWSSTADLGGGTIQALNGTAEVALNGASADGGRATKFVNFPDGRGGMAEFDFTVVSTDQGAGDEMTICQFSDEQATPTQVYLKAMDDDLELAIEGDDFGAASFSGFPLTVGQTYRIRLRVLGYNSPSSDGIVQLWVDDDLVADHYLVDTIDDTRIQSFSIWCQSDTGDTTTALTRYDNVRVCTFDDALVDDGGGEDAVNGLRGGNCIINDPNVNTGLRVPDSDVLVFLRQINPQVQFDQKVFNKLVQRIEDIRPVHVEVAIIGSGVDEVEIMEMTDAYTAGFLFELAESLEFDDLGELFTDSVVVPDALVMFDDFDISGGSIRWSTTGDRWGNDSRRWSRGGGG